MEEQTKWKNKGLSLPENNLLVGNSNENTPSSMALGVPTRERISLRHKLVSRLGCLRGEATQTS